MNGKPNELELLRLAEDFLRDPRDPEAFDLAYWRLRDHLMNTWPDEWVSEGLDFMDSMDSTLDRYWPGVPDSTDANPMEISAAQMIARVRRDVEAFRPIAARLSEAPTADGGAGRNNA